MWGAREPKLWSALSKGHTQAVRHQTATQMVRSRPTPAFGRDLKELCSIGRIPVFRDCILFLTKPRDGRKPALCLEGLFKSTSTDRKVHLLQQAYQLGRNPLRMLGLQDPYAVAGLLQVWLRELPEPLIQAKLFAEVVHSQQHQDELQRLHSLQDMLKQIDSYRLRILLPLLELLHHYCINQRNIQLAAEYVGNKFASYLLRPAHQASPSSQDTALAASACTAMILEYRTLFSQSMVDVEGCAAQQRTACGVNAPQLQPGMHAAMPCPMPTSPRAAKRHPSLGFDFRSEPEDYDRGNRSSGCTPCLFGSPVSDDMDSAFSGSSVEMEDSKSSAEFEGVDDDLAHAVDSLFLESTSDLLFTNKGSEQLHGSLPNYHAARAHCRQATAHQLSHAYTSSRQSLWGGTSLSGHSI